MSDKVGYGHPPVATRFVKGRSGNPGGKRRPASSDNMRAILTDPINVTVNGKVRRIPPFELALCTLFEKAMSGDMVAAKACIRACAAAGLFDVPEALSYRINFVPKEWRIEDWRAMYALHGPPPWEGAHDGLVPVERRANLGRLKDHA